MTWLIEPVLMGIALAMDALGVSIALGTAERKNFTWGKMALTAFFFGAFQMGMPLAGWWGGALCGELLRVWGRYAAALLLLLLGGKMIWEACRKKPEEELPGFRFGRLVGLAFATSIDAFLVGVSYACLQRVNILSDTAVIGLVTMLISLGGCIAGRLFGAVCGSRGEIIGGVVLMGIGLKTAVFG